MQELTIIGVFIAGLLSFFSPCIIPLIPMYIGFLAGDFSDEPTKKYSIYINAFGFFIGLMGVFIALGAAATALGGFLFSQMLMFRQVLGVIVILFGVFQLGIYTPNFMKVEKKFRVRAKSASFTAAVLMGAAFSFAWTPCVGPILGSVLLLAASTETLAVGIGFLGVYALGFAIPFAISTVLIGVMGSSMTGVAENLTKYVKPISGVLLIIMGYLIFNGTVSQLTQMLS